MKTQIKQFDLYGKRNHKYDFLLNNNLKSINWNELKPSKPNFIFNNKDFSELIFYNKGFKIDLLFKLISSGVTTSNDTLLSDFNIVLLNQKLRENNILDINNSEFFKLGYKPFDNRIFYLDKKYSKRSRESLIKNYRHKNEIITLNFRKTAENSSTWQHTFLTKYPVEGNYFSARSYSLPLFLENLNQGEQGELIEQTRTPNLNLEIVREIEKVLGLEFRSEKETTPSFGHPSKGGELEEDSLKNNPLTNNYQTKNSPPDGGVAASADGVVLSKENEILTTINNIQIIKRAVHELPHNPKLRQLAIEKRKEGILSEVLFWKQVHKGKFHNIDFDRQRVIGSYIVDFYVKNLGLVVEIDGASHDNKGEYDEAREGYLKSLGLKIFKTYDKDIKKNIHWVMKRLEDFIIEEFGEMPTPSASRHPSEGGELEEVSLKNNPLTNNYQTKNSPPDGGVAASADGVVQNTFAPIDLLDYIYAVLHSPAYREKYKEFLKIDFPRVPYPNIKTFWKLVELGKQIREIHLLESPIVEDYITKYPIDGSNIVEKVSYKDGNVFINSEQYFEGVPEVAWNFYIGGYQPAQKWLKDRKDRELNFDDIMHYQKIIVALTETDKLMNEIDNIGVE